MEIIRIQGGQKLSGKVGIRGAKNSALPLMVSSLLTEDQLTLDNLPQLADISTMEAILINHGVQVEWQRNGLDSSNLVRLNAENITNTTADHDLVRKMRASILVLGPLLARKGNARVSLPGGCAIGTRPVDIHLSGLSQLGAEITLVDGYVEANAPNRLRGSVLSLPFPSVGATENLMMAATLATGTTVIKNAACEPEVEDLARCLVKMGANIQGIGTNKLEIEGEISLNGTKHSVIPDRIEAGTYAIAAAITYGEVELQGVIPKHLETTLTILDQAGIKIQTTLNSVMVSATKQILARDIATSVYPGFPTDLQAQAMALMAIAEGPSVIRETIFENRFMHVPELIRLGANITIKGPTAVVRGVKNLHGAPLMATDLRASSSLVIAGLAAKGETTVSQLHHIDRGYEKIEERLSGLGAVIAREAV
ncbi:MAG: UDP-N-acetylglucosamine 1-carboxyvinyltransferase [Alphaproteobacteria bacterium]|nr:UDP-N-acetylglucosamine 1-carboxyvinyltransferase [Alphaproteobacteria bacterium]|tara:strand:+ start:832 stop:2106 length:1275 start_codon:yes stop_codon:yes gene_type:complete